MCKIFVTASVEAAVQDPFARWLFVQGVYKRSPRKMSVNGCKRSLSKISAQAL